MSSFNHLLVLLLAKKQLKKNKIKDTDKGLLLPFKISSSNRKKSISSFPFRSKAKAKKWIKAKGKKGETYVLLDLYTV